VIDLKPFEVVRLKRMTVVRHHEVVTSSFNYSAGKKQEFILLLLDCIPEGEAVDGDKILNEAGWQFVGHPVVPEKRSGGSA
jgi:hypothetical protein